LLEDHAAGSWQFRRDHRITVPLERFGRTTVDGIPHTALDVALLYKARWHEVEKNARDFDAAVRGLGAAERTWLADAVALSAPGHPWLARLC
jgi:hypothetical protein